ncbi:MAG: adenosylhomocysteinase [Candidatus Anstonellales archaeon]
MSIFDWTKYHMPVLQYFKEQAKKEKILKDKNIGIVLHLEKKTAILIEAILDSGANVYCASCNPLTTDQSAANYVKELGAEVYAKEFESEKEYVEFLQKIAEKDLDAIIDDGADLIYLLHEKEFANKNLYGACEETTTGILRAKQLEATKRLRFPVIAVNNANSKRLFDNVYGTGESAIAGILNITNLTLAGKVVAVFGYGQCGKGIAKKLKGLGAKVIVVEVNHVDTFGYSGIHKALEAYFEGYEVMDSISACKKADIIITATGNTKVVTEKHFNVMKNGIILANAGHFNVEIDVEYLEKNATSKREINKAIKEYTLNGKKLYLLADGRLVNLAKPYGQGHAIEIMDLSFSIQFLSLQYLIKNHDHLDNKVINVPKDIDITVARKFLELKEIKIEELTTEQKAYLKTSH